MDLLIWLLGSRFGPRKLDSVEVLWENRFGKRRKWRREEVDLPVWGWELGTGRVEICGRVGRGAEEEERMGAGLRTGKAAA